MTGNVTISIQKYPTKLSGRNLIYPRTTKTSSIVDYLYQKKLNTIH